jgi:hypothetical protein
MFTFAASPEDAKKEFASQFGDYLAIGVNIHEGVNLAGYKACVSEQVIKEAEAMATSLKEYKEAVAKMSDEDKNDWDKVAALPRVPGNYKFYLKHHINWA